MSNPQFNYTEAITNYSKVFENPSVGLGYNLSVARQNYTTEPNIRVRPGYDRSIYEAYRPENAIPIGTTQEELQAIMLMCRASYERVGVIRSVIDLMSEYVCDGITIEHPDEGPNNFYKAWFEKIKGQDRAERFASWLYKSGNVVVRRKMGTIKLTGKTANIPLEYIFYDPSTVTLVGGHAAALAERKTYGIQMPYKLWSDLRAISPEYVKQIERSLPREVLDSMNNPGGSSYFVIEIPSDKVYVGHYKKDDSDIWAKSFIYSIISDVQYNDKIKLAKISAMDGIINVVRLWNIGLPEHNMFPTPAQFAKLATILESNTGGGAADILWGPDLKLTEFYPPIGDLVNFEENLDPILVGLGVPQSLVGGVNDKTNVSVNFTGLKNLIKRLEAGRREVVKWLQSERDIIQKEMGFKKKPYIRFNNSNLYDERVFLDLLLDLVDRDIISDSTVLERIKEIPEMEQLRIKREYDKRDSGELPEKASPFHNPTMPAQRDHEIKLEKLKQSSQMSKEKPAGNPGRPNGSKDKVKRTRGPKSFGDIATYANKLYDYLDNQLTSQMVAEAGVRDYRGLSSETKQKILASIREVLPYIEPSDNISDEHISLSLEQCVGPTEDYTKYLQHSKSDINKEDEKIMCITAYTQAWFGLEN